MCPEWHHPSGMTVSTQEKQVPDCQLGAAPSAKRLARLPVEDNQANEPNHTQCECTRLRRHHQGVRLPDESR
jgi:hypothetical protein